MPLKPVLLPGGGTSSVLNRLELTRELKEGVRQRKNCTHIMLSALSSLCAAAASGNLTVTIKVDPGAGRIDFMQVF